MRAEVSASNEKAKEIFLSPCKLSAEMFGENETMRESQREKGGKRRCHYLVIGSLADEQSASSAGLPEKQGALESTPAVRRSNVSRFNIPYVVLCLQRIGLPGSTRSLAPHTCWLF